MPGLKKLHTYNIGNMEYQIFSKKSVQKFSWHGSFAKKVLEDLHHSQTFYINVLDQYNILMYFNLFIRSVAETEQKLIFYTTLAWKLN